MKRFLAVFFLLVIIGLSIAPCLCSSENYSFYIKAGSGVSSSQSANVVAPYPPWNPADQGYNAQLGHCPIASLSVGCEIFQVMDVEGNFSTRSMFTYRKCQTPTAGGTSYIREFDLDVTSILFSINLLGRGIPHLNWDVGCGKIYPLLGGGVGRSNLLITNYRTTGLLPTGDSSPYPSFSAENEYTLRKNFTYTILLGIEYNHNAYWAIGTGYRWFNAGCFQGPRYQRVESGAAVDVACDAWKMRLRANEWFIECKIYI